MSYPLWKMGGYAKSTFSALKASKYGLVRQAVTKPKPLSHNTLVHVMEDVYTYCRWSCQRSRLPCNLYAAAINQPHHLTGCRDNKDLSPQLDLDA